MRYRRFSGSEFALLFGAFQMAGVMSAACFIGSVARQAFSQRLLSGFARLHLLFQAACARAIAIFRAGVRIAVARVASFARGLRRSRR